MGQSRTDLRIVVLDFAMRRSQSSGVSQVMNEMFLSRSAWLIELHWSSCRLPGKTKSSASSSASHGARSVFRTPLRIAAFACGEMCRLWRSPIADGVVGRF
jgi:hypothetical protein